MRPRTAMALMSPRRVLVRLNRVRWSGCMSRPRSEPEGPTAAEQHRKRGAESDFERIVSALRQWYLWVDARVPAQRFDRRDFHRAEGNGGAVYSRGAREIVHSHACNFDCAERRRLLPDFPC